MDYFRSHRLRLVEFNVENLFVYLDPGTRLPDDIANESSSVTEREWKRFSSSTQPNKPLKAVREIAQTIRQMDPDILMLCEVGGKESLINFSRYFLNDAFEAHLIEGNSDRGIDLGYLVKRNLPFHYDLISHKHRHINFLYPHERQTIESGYDHLRSARLTSHRFSRDVLEMRVFEKGQDAPAFIVLLVHLKSQLDRGRIDPSGRDRRRAELETLVAIYNEIQSDVGERTPVLLTGDFNGNAAFSTNDRATDSEFEALYKKTDLRDCLEVATVSLDERFTHMQMRNNRESTDRQLDYIFIPPSLFRRVDREDTWVFRYQDASGRTKFLPRNLNEKRLLPSDHYPVILTLKPSSREE